MRRSEVIDRVPDRSRPSAQRAAAAARLAGAPAGEEDVRARMKHAARRARRTHLAPPPGAVPSPAAVAGAVPSPAVSGASALAVAPSPRPAPRPDEQPRPRHLRVVPEGLTPAQRRRRARAILVAGIGAAATIGLALVYFHVVLAQRQFAIDRLQTQVQQAQATYEERRLQVAQLGSPQHIVATAEGQLGMVQPSKITYYTPTGGATVTSGQSGKQPLGQAPGTTSLAPSQAPAGDADWPRIKSQLAGIP